MVSKTLLDLTFVCLYDFISSPLSTTHWVQVLSQASPSLPSFWVAFPGSERERFFLIIQVSAPVSPSRKDLPDHFL